MAEAPALIKSEEAWREIASRCTQDFGLYCTFVRGLRPAWHHRITQERLLTPAEGGNGGPLERILGPPDTAKTQQGTMYAEGKPGRDPNFRWLIASEVGGGIASQIVTEMADTITHNERYHMVFGDLRGPGAVGWSSFSFRLRPYISQAESLRLRKTATPEPPFSWLPPRGRMPGLRGENAKAVGWQTGYTGVRADGLIADDLVSDRTSRSQIMTTQLFRTLHQKMLARG